MTFLVTGMTDGRAGIGIVAFQLKAVLMDETPSRNLSGKRVQKSILELKLPE